ncbi:hypothetical protein V8C42DRAFT_349400 [Trichoderma barbatum]
MEEKLGEPSKATSPTAQKTTLSTYLSVFFPDDITNQHDDAEHSLVYASPKLPNHYLWNASLLLAELIKRDSLGPTDNDEEKQDRGLGGDINFDNRGLHNLELGAGTALPSMIAGLLGAASAVV